MKRILFILCLIATGFSLYSQEIAQWRGPNRDGIYNETGLLKSWPKHGPTMLWSNESLGDGHAAVAVTKSKVFAAGTLDEMGFIVAFDHSGKVIWKTEYGKEWTDSFSGVRSAPLFYIDKVYTLSSFGELVCMDAEKGNILWKVDVTKTYDGENIKWGYTENLLIDDDKLYCTPGGKNDNVLALNKDTGKLIWKSKGNSEKSAYCSPMVVKLANRKIVVTHTENSIIGIDAADGKFLWFVEHPNEWSVQPNTPIYHDGLLYCTSGYGQGGVMLKLSPDGASVTEVWRNKILDPKMGGMVLVNGRIYGSGDNTRKWYCLDWKTGETLFSSEMMKRGDIIYADGLLYCYDDGGTMGLVEPGENDFKLISSFKVPLGENQHWAHPVIHDKKLYIRHGSALMVYDIGAK
jgi:outer membrane protein assembly factor BamB